MATDKIDPSGLLLGIDGDPLTGRMKAMGVTGMMTYDGGWTATFAAYPGMSLPPSDAGLRMAA